MGTFGEIIKRNRKAFNLTLEKLANKIGSQKGYLCGIESGKCKPPSWRVTRKLCSILNLDYEEMLLLGWAQKAPKDVRAKALSFVGR